MKIPINLQLIVSALLGLAGAQVIGMGDKLLGQAVVLAGIAIAAHVIWRLWKQPKSERL